MAHNRLTGFLAAMLLYTVCGELAAAELLTLFTTPAERQIINSNRYKSDNPKPVVKPSDEPRVETPIQQLLMEEVKREYRITGITLSSDGPPTVWVNGIAYADGDLLDDNSRVRVIVGNEIQARITAPDGKHYFASSGQSLEVTYQAPVEN